MNEIGPYQVISELGRGGMATVYRALQPSVNRIVALKVLPAHLEEDAEALRRFRREAEVAANLTHENIVKVWDASVTDPPYYIAMEFLDGGTLAARLSRGPLPVEEAVLLASKVCSALDHAHQRGVVHRDIKPANIMFDSTGRPVVTDFGIARTSETTQLTAPGAKFGTPNYMSAEQASGMPTDARTDICSVGAVLYEMVAGRPPFGGDDPLTVMYRIVNEFPALPSAFNPRVPRALEAVILRALDKDPRHRYQTGAEMAAALASAMRTTASPAATLMTIPDAPTAALGGAPFDVAQDRRAPRPTATRRRWSLALGAMLAVLAVAAVGVGYLSTRGRSPTRARATSVPSSADHNRLGGDARAAAQSSSTSGQESSTQDRTGGGRVNEAPGSSSLTELGERPAPLSSKVPNVVGETSEVAQAALREGGFVPAVTTRSDAAPKGRVIGQQPAAGQEHPEGAQVTIIVSSGRPAGRTASRPSGASVGSRSPTTGGHTTRSPTARRRTGAESRSIAPTGPSRSSREYRMRG